jgi:ABC-2 family transporter protein
MTRLMKVELSRILSRRLFRLTAVLGLLAVLAVDGLIAGHSSTDVTGATARANTELQQQYQSCLSAVGQPGGGPTKQDCDSELPAGQVKDCLAHLAAQPVPGVTAADCRNNAGSNPYYNDPRFHFAEHAKDLLTGAAFILMAVGLVVAASSVGAEWQAGTFASLLTWEPRRQRVLAAKLVAPVIAIAVLAVTLGAVLVAGAVVAANTRGTMDGTTSHLVGQLFVMAARVVGLVALVTLMGAALAAFTRHTVAVVAVVGGYLIAGELVGAIVSEWWRNHGLAAQLVAFVQGDYRYSVHTRTLSGDVFTNHFLHAGGAALIVSALAALAVVTASVTLGRRDVT